MALRFHHDNVKKLREGLGLSQHAFGGRIGLPGQHISMYENGKMTPRVQTVLRMIDEFGLSLEYFFTDTG